MKRARAVCVEGHRGAVRLITAHCALRHTEIRAALAPRSRDLADYADEDLPGEFDFCLEK